MNRKVRCTGENLECHGRMRVRKGQNEPSVLAQRACFFALELPSAQVIISGYWLCLF